MANLVTVKPIEKNRWHGLNGDKYLKRPIIIEALKNKNGSYETGLSEKDEEELQPFFPYSLKKVFKENDENSIWLRPEGRFEMRYKTHILDLEKPIDRLRYGLIKASPFVANTQNEYDEGKYPLAEFIISDSREEAEALAKRNEIKEKVFVALTKMDHQRKVEFCMILGNENVKKMSEVEVSNRVHKLLEEKGYKKAYDIVCKTKEENTLTALVIEAEQKKILSKKGEVYYFFDDELGNIDNAVAFLKEVKNSGIKAQIIEQIKRK